MHSQKAVSASTYGLVTRGAQAWVSQVIIAWAAMSWVASGQWWEARASVRLSHSDAVHGLEGCKWPVQTSHANWCWAAVARRSVLGMCGHRWATM